MASSTNRSLKVKFQRSRVQAREAINQEMTKACYRTPKVATPLYDDAMVRRVPFGFTSQGKPTANRFRVHF